MPVMDQVNTVMGEKLPDTFDAVSSSLLAAEQAATSLEGAIKSFEAFQALLGATPFLSAVVPVSSKPYNPETSLAESLGDLSTSLEEMPSTFQEMSSNIDKADDNLESVKNNLDTMAKNVSLISSSLSQYQDMIGESQSSMDNLREILTNVQSNLDTILNVTGLVLGLFFLWLLAAQAVIFSQGLELYRGTAGRMEAAPEKTPVKE
jgi:prefoldin subunit 5